MTTLKKIKSYKISGKALDLSNAFGYLKPAEVFLLQAVASALPENAVMVNIGAGVGTSSLAVAEIRHDVQIYTIDISSGGPFGGFQNEANAFNLYQLGPIPTQIMGKSQEIGPKWPEISNYLPIHLLSIDGDHSKAGIEGDLLGWLPYIAPGGYLVIHDYGNEVWPEVTETVDEMVADGWGYVHLADSLIVFQRENAP